MAGKEVGRILHPDVAFDQRLGKVRELTDSRYQQRRGSRLRRGRGTALRKISWHSIATMMPVTMPPTAPSMVFFGLTTGASACFPKRFPTKYAPVSIIHITMNRK